jgi:hypothetical protein
MSISKFSKYKLNYVSQKDNCYQTLTVKARCNDSCLKNQLLEKGEIRRFTVWGQPRQKVRKTLSQPTSLVANAVTPATWEAYIGKRLISLGKNTWPYLKITKAKKGLGAWLLVQLLPSKFEDLSSNPSTTRKRERRKEKPWLLGLSDDLKISKPLGCYCVILFTVEVTLNKTTLPSLRSFFFLTGWPAGQGGAQEAILLGVHLHHVIGNSNYKHCGYFPGKDGVSCRSGIPGSRVRGEPEFT